MGWFDNQYEPETSYQLESYYNPFEDPLMVVYSADGTPQPSSFWTQDPASIYDIQFAYNLWANERGLTQLGSDFAGLDSFAPNPWDLYDDGWAMQQNNMSGAPEPQGPICVNPMSGCQ